MFRNRIFGALAAFAVTGLVACNGGATDDAQTIQQDTAFETMQTVDTVQQPVEVTEQDTIAVEQEVEVQADTVVDTRNDGGI